MHNMTNNGTALRIVHDTFGRAVSIPIGKTVPVELNEKSAKRFAAAQKMGDTLHIVDLDKKERRQLLPMNEEDRRELSDVNRSNGGGEGDHREGGEERPNGGEGEGTNSGTEKEPKEPETIQEVLAVADDMVISELRAHAERLLGKGKIKANANRATVMDKLSKAAKK